MTDRPGEGIDPEAEGVDPPASTSGGTSGVAGGQEGPPPGWWLASDGRWYPPASDAGPTGATAPPAGGRGMNRLAIASLVASIAWVCGIGSIAGVITGFMARSQIKRSRGTETGDGLAIAGIILGFLGLLGVVAAFAVQFAFNAGPTLRGSGTSDVFLDTRQLADAKAVQSELRNALAAEKVIYSEEQRYSEEPEVLASEEPSVRFVRGLVPGPGFVSVATSEDGQLVCLSGRTRDGAVYALIDSAMRGTFFGSNQIMSCNDQATQGMHDNADAGWSDPR